MNKKKYIDIDVLDMLIARVVDRRDHMMFNQSPALFPNKHEFLRGIRYALGYIEDYKKHTQTIQEITGGLTPRGEE